MFAKRFIQTVTYMPYFISTVVICGIIVDFTSSDGVFGAVATMLGKQAVNLLGDAKYFRAVYVLSELWQRLGWDSIIFLSALAAINYELYEAARIDGASRFKQVLHVTIPGLAPTIHILFILRMGGILNVGFEKVMLLYKEATYEVADVISTYVYRRGIVGNATSYAAAVGLFNSVVNVLFLVGTNALSRRVTDMGLF